MDDCENNKYRDNSCEDNGYSNDNWVNNDWVADNSVNYYYLLLLLFFWWLYCIYCFFLALFLVLPLNLTKLPTYHYSANIC